MASPEPRLIDCHLHLQDPVLLATLDDVLARAAEAGVARFVCNGSCESDWPAVASLARRDSRILPCFGLHLQQSRQLVDQEGDLAVAIRVLIQECQETVATQSGI